MPIDVALREPLRESEAPLGSIRSLVVLTPLVRDLGPSFASWRAVAPSRDRG